MPREVGMATTEELLYRLSSVEDRLQGLKDEVDAIRRLVPAAEPEAPPVPEASPVPAATSVPPILTTTAAPREPFPSRTPKPAPSAYAPPPRPPAEPREPFDFAALFGPKAFAWAGGVVTLLGILFFFFALAVN